MKFETNLCFLRHFTNMSSVLLIYFTPYAQKHKISQYFHPLTESIAILLDSFTVSAFNTKANIYYTPFTYKSNRAGIFHSLTKAVNLYTKSCDKKLIYFVRFEHNMHMTISYHSIDLPMNSHRRWKKNSLHVALLHSFISCGLDLKI